MPTGTNSKGEQLNELYYGNQRNTGPRTRSDLWDCLAGLALELEAPELLPEIRRAYEDGLLSPEMNIEEIEEYLYEADWEGFGSLISHAFSGAHSPALDLMTGKGWWTRSDREPRRSAKRKRDSA